MRTNAIIISGGPSIDEYCHTISDVCDTSDTYIFAVNAGRKFWHDWSVSLDANALIKEEGVVRPNRGFIGPSEAIDKIDAVRSYPLNMRIDGDIRFNDSWKEFYKSNCPINFSICLAILCARRMPYLAFGDVIDNIVVFGADHTNDPDAVGNIDPTSVDHSDDRWKKEMSQIPHVLMETEMKGCRVYRFRDGKFYQWILDWVKLPEVVL